MSIFRSPAEPEGKVLEDFHDDRYLNDRTLFRANYKNILFEQTRVCQRGSFRKGQVSKS